MSFVDKVIIVTGASSGIGAAIAIKFATVGANIVITGRNKAKLESVGEKCECRGRKPLIIVADLINDEENSRVVSETILHYGKLDILVNNAGIASITSIHDENVMDQFDWIMATNLRSVVKITNMAASYLIESKGNIINISSIGSTIVAGRKNFAYCTSKAGLDHFTRCVALELASKGVRVNLINPGPVRTDIIKNMNVPEIEQQAIWDAMQSSTVFNRLSDPEEIAELALFLASDKATSITGSIHFIDNGAILKRIQETEEPNIK